MVAGLIFGILAANVGASQFVIDWIKPFGTIFINALKMIAVPLILVSLIAGIANLKDLASLSRMGTKTICLYLITTVIAVTTGLVLVNIIQPGKSFPEEKRIEFNQKYQEKTQSKTASAGSVKDAGPLQPLVDMVPKNIFQAMANMEMLQVIVFALLFGISLIMIDPQIAKPVIDFFKGADQVIMKLVDLIMLTAPYGVFALMASLIPELAGNNPSEAWALLKALASYSLVVVTGLAMMIFLVYPFLLKTFTRYNIRHFFQAIAPAQLLAFSTSSRRCNLARHDGQS